MQYEKSCFIIINFNIIREVGSFQRREEKHLHKFWIRILECCVHYRTCMTHPTKAVFTQENIWPDFIGVLLDVLHLAQVLQLLHPPVQLEQFLRNVLRLALQPLLEPGLAVGWSDLAPFAIFEERHVSAAQVYFNNSIKLRISPHEQQSFHFQKINKDLSYTSKNNW